MKASYQIDVAYNKYNPKLRSKALVQEHFKDAVGFEIMQQGLLFIKMAGEYSQKLPGSFKSNLTWIPLADIVSLQMVESCNFADKKDRERWAEDNKIPDVRK